VEVSIPVRSDEVLNTTSLHPGEYEDFKKAALDPYVALRSAYYETRQNFTQKTRSTRKFGGSRQGNSSARQIEVNSTTTTATKKTNSTAPATHTEEFRLGVRAPHWLYP
jgi:ABC-type transporter lipoprotein component MlaA